MPARSSFASGAVVIAVLTGCGGPNSATGSWLAPGSGGDPMALSSPRMDTAQCGASVVYIASQNFSVYAYDQNVKGKGATPCGQVSGLKYPAGMHVDRHGNLWVAIHGDCKTSFSSTFKFAPGKAEPKKVFQDTAGSASDVAVDDASRTVYVTNEFNYTSDCRGGKRGTVEVYERENVFPTRTLSDRRMYYAMDDAVDKEGNLYVVYLGSKGASGSAGILKWRHGRGSAIDLGIKLPGAGGIQTTATGALAICDSLECGELARGRLTKLFANQYHLVPTAIALAQDEKSAWVQDAFGLSQRYRYPGPDKRPERSLRVPGEGDVGIAVYPPAPPGKPY